MTAHSKIGASSMKRWASCPGSVRLSRDIESRSSVFAEEGTLAHAVGEAWLDGDAHVAGAPFHYDDHGVVKTATLTQEMLDHVHVYVDAVRERWTDEYSANLLVEQRFHLSDLHADLFGTSDAVVWQPEIRRLSVLDLKYGAGVAVEVTDNPQLLYYGLGALLANPQWKPVEVEVVIAQPRCPHSDGPVRAQIIPVVDLIDFAGDLVDAVTRTEDANAAYEAWNANSMDLWATTWLNPGDHCRWCPANGVFQDGQFVCKALERKAQETAKQVFAPGVPFDQKNLADTLEWLPVLEAWLHNVREFAYAEARAGREVPRHKLVEKRATRKWKDLAAAEEMLGAYLVSEALYEPEVIKSPAAVEKLLAKEDRSILDQLCTKESSGHTLVHESDRREAIKVDAKSAFTGV